MSFDAAGWLNQLYSVPDGTPGGVGAVDAYGKNVAAGMAQGAMGYGNAGMAMLNSYQNEYQPYDRKFMNYVDNLGTDAYRAQQRGQAMTNVNMQAGQQMQAMNRNLGRMGINPNSAAFAAMNGQMAQQNALNKVTAAMGADRSARNEWAKGLGAINAMGIKAGELGVKAGAVASDMSKVGLAGADLGSVANDRYTNAQASMASAGAAGANAAAAGRNADTNALQAQNTYNLGLGRLAYDRWNAGQNWDYNNKALQNKIDAGSLDNTFVSQVVGQAGTAVGNVVGNTIKGLTMPSGQYVYNQDDGSFSVVPPGSFNENLIPAANPFPTEE